MPLHELVIEVCTVLHTHEGCGRENVLDLGGDLAEFDVLNQRYDACVLANNVLCSCQ